MRLVTRDEWGAAPPRRGLSTGSPGDALVVHHVGDGQTPAPATIEEASEALRGVQNGHYNSPDNYADIAYNMAVDQAGNRYQLRGMDYLGGATFGANDHTRAVLWLGDSRYDTPTDAAIGAIAGLYVAGVQAGNLEHGAEINGHRDYVATICPGPALYDRLSEIRALAAGAPQPPSHLPSVGDDDMTPEQSAAFAIMTGVLTPAFEPYGRPASLADLAQILHTNLPALADAVAADQATSEAVLTALRSIDAKMDALVRGMTAARVGPSSGSPTAEEIVAAFLARLNAQSP